MTDNDVAEASTKSTPDGPIAYLTGHYPMISHTFILREVFALRKQGLKVLTCSIRRPSNANFIGADEIAALNETFYVVAAALNLWCVVLSHLSVLRRSPRGWLSALLLAWRTRPPGVKALLWQFFYFLEAAVLVRHLRQKGVVHLHNHFADSSCSVAMLTSVMSGIPFSFTLHGPAIFFEPMRWRIDEKIARACFVACISHFARSQAMLFSDRSHWDKLKIVHCGVDPAKYGRRSRKNYGKRVLFVGRLTAVKGVPLLIEAVASVRKEHPDVRLTIIGDGPDRTALEAQAAALGISRIVTFAGYQPQERVSELFEEADMLLLPSFAEGVPVVLMEAMASRLPVIASRVGGVAELVEDGVSGFVISPGDMKTLVERLGTLLSDPGRCAGMGEAGRAKVEAEFSLEREANWLKRLFCLVVLPTTLRWAPDATFKVAQRSLS
jgi:glycosyltransferase involved in cell wall biosynthesis